MSPSAIAWWKINTWSTPRKTNKNKTTIGYFYVCVMVIIIEAADAMD